MHVKQPCPFKQAHGVATLLAYIRGGFAGSGTLPGLETRRFYFGRDGSLNRG